MIIREFKGIIKKNKKDIEAAVIIFVFYLIVEIIFKITCPFRFFLGVSCAGCGMSRAYLALLHLDFKNAFYYHPLFPFPMIFVVMYLFRDRINKKISVSAITLSAIAFVAVYLYRLIYITNDNIVIFEPYNGLIYKIIVLIKEYFI